MTIDLADHRSAVRPAGGDPAAGTWDAEHPAAPAPHEPPTAHPEDHVTTIGDVMTFGLTVGTVLMTAVSVIIGLVAGLDPGRALAIAVWPGIVAGLFFGGLIRMGRLASGHHPDAGSRRD